RPAGCHRERPRERFHVRVEQCSVSIPGQGARSISQSGTGVMTAVWLVQHVDVTTRGISKDEEVVRLVRTTAPVVELATLRRCRMNLIKRGRDQGRLRRSKRNRRVQ